MKKGIIITLLIVIVGATGFYFFAAQNKDKAVSELNIDIPELVKENLLYGLNVDTFSIESSKIEPGMFLGTLFEKYGVMSKLHTIVKKTEGIFDVRKIKRDQKYTVFFSKDSSKTVNYIVYEKNKIDFVVFDLNDTLNVYLDKKKVEIKVNETGGIINSSLWIRVKSIMR